MPWKLKQLKVIVAVASVVICLIHAEGAERDHLSGALLRRAQRAWLPNGHRLVGVGNRLYRIDSRRRIQWTHDEVQILFDFVYVEATRLVYVTAGDNNFTHNNWGYRDRGLRDMKDGVSAWRGTDLLWQRELPADSSLLVRDRDIYAVYKHRGAMVRLKVHPPRSAALPKD